MLDFTLRIALTSLGYTPLASKTSDLIRLLQENGWACFTI
jgi:hypothetical protein